MIPPQVDAHIYKDYVSVKRVRQSITYTYEHIPIPRYELYDRAHVATIS
jgi:hypothetical protein